MDGPSDETRESLSRTPAHELAVDCLLAGIEAAHPSAIVADAVSVHGESLTITAVDGTSVTYDLSAYGDVIVIGGGNAAGEMAAALETRLGDRLAGGVVVTDTPAETTDVETVPGDHPLPSPRGVAGTERLLERVDAAGADDLIISVISGGGSALLAAPVDSIGVGDLRRLTTELLASGAPIDEINAVRKHCSAIKGGRLARRSAPASVVNLVLSDVVGDDLGVIASGPTAPDPTTYADALSVVDGYDLELPTSVREHLRAGTDGEVPETPTTSDPAFDRIASHVIGNGRNALTAAAKTAADHGYESLLLAAGVRGEARESALTHAAIAAECRETGSPTEPPVVLLSGGETTVTLAEDHGKGGPNQEFALSAGVELDDADIVVGSVDTDGIDGATDVAGAVVDADTVSEERARAALDRNDAFPALDDADALLRTGPTGTNVNDLRVFVVPGPE